MICPLQIVVSANWFTRIGVRFPWVCCHSEILSECPLWVDCCRKHFRIPATYEQAQLALAQCAKLDECKDWVDKFAALGSYARQAANHDLEELAYKIHARAIRRCGEIMREIAVDHNRGNQYMPTHAEHTQSLTRTQATKDAGMTEHLK
jgi:hypothetical protein